MESPPQIPLAILQTSSFIAEKTFLEQIPYHYVEQLINSQHLMDKWDLTNYSQKEASKNYLNEREQLKSYLDKFKKKNNCFVVNYKKARHGWGRVFPIKSLGLTSFAKKTRNTLIKDTYYDFDLKNCQPEILRNICKANNILCPVIDKYCNERETIILDIIKNSDNKCNRDLVKSLMIRLSFCGTFEGWLKENNIPEFPEPIIVKNYRLELDRIIDIFIKDNLKLNKTMSDQKKANGGGNTKGSFMSTYLQNWEIVIVENVLKYLCSETNICSSDIPNHFLVTYEFDGLKLLKNRVDSFGGVQKILEIMNKLNMDLGFDILWEDKPIEKFYNISFTNPVIMDKETQKEHDRKLKEDEKEKIKLKKVEEKKEKFLKDREDLERTNRDIIAKNDLEASQMIYEKIKNNIKYSNGIMYYKHNYLWISNFEMIRSLVGNLIRNSGIRRLNAFNQIEDYVQNRKHGMNVLNDVLDIAIRDFDNSWTKIMFSSSLGRILFTNGYYDFYKSIFFKFGDKDYDNSIIFIEQIPHDFIPLTDDIENNFIAEDYINSIKKRLFIEPFGDNVADYYLLNIARGIAGDSMKRALFCIGDSNTGKSSITASIDNSCGGYCGTFNANNIITKKMVSGDDAQQLRWIMMLLSKRIIISNEIESDAVISGTMLKKISSGGLDKIVARGHGKNETEFKISFLPMVFANDIDKISPMDDAVVSRVRAINYQKVYTENPKPENLFELKIDPNFKYEIETYNFKIGFMTLLMRSYKKFIDEGRIEIEPSEIKKAIVSSFGKIEDYVTKLQNDFEITNDEDDYVESPVIQEWIKINKLNISMTKLGRDLNKYCEIKKFINVNNGYKKINGKTKTVWYGIKKIDDICL